MACMRNRTRSKGFEKLMAIAEKRARLQLSMRVIYCMGMRVGLMGCDRITFIIIIFEGGF